MTKKKNYWSDRAGANVTAGQYLAEFICERMAQKKGLALAGKYWNEPAWGKVFRQQVRLACSLLKLYTPDVILSVLRQEQNVYSLAAPWLDPLLAHKAKEISRRQEEQQQEAPPPAPAPPCPALADGPRPVALASANTGVLGKMEELRRKGMTGK